MRPARLAATARYAVFHNYVRIHKTLKSTPAMAAGLTKTLWSMGDLVAMIDAVAQPPSGLASIALKPLSAALVYLLRVEMARRSGPRHVGDDGFSGRVWTFYTERSGCNHDSQHETERMPTLYAISVPATLVWIGMFGNHALAMRREQRYRGSWGAFFWAFFPALLAAIYLTTDQGVGVIVRNVVLGLLGGAVGIAGAIWIGYFVSDYRAKGQSLYPLQPTVSSAPAANRAASQNTIAAALRIELGTDSRFERIDHFPNGVVRRIIHIAIHNKGNGFLSECKLMVQATSPLPVLGRVPACLAHGVRLPNDEYLFIPIIGFAERTGTTSYLQNDNIIVAVPPAAGFFAEATMVQLASTARENATIITLEASALECSPAVRHFRVWANSDRRLHMESA